MRICAVCGQDQYVPLLREKYVCGRGEREEGGWVGWRKGGSKEGSKGGREEGRKEGGEGQSVWGGREREGRRQENGERERGRVSEEESDGGTEREGARAILTKET